MRLGKSPEDSQGLEHFDCEESLRQLGPHGSSSQPASTYEEVMENKEPSLHHASGRTKANERKVKEERFRQDRRAPYFARSSAKCWNSHPERLGSVCPWGFLISD